MANLLILHHGKDAQAAGAVATVLAEFAPYTLEIDPKRAPLRLGANVVPLVLWSPLMPGDAEQAFADVVTPVKERMILLNLLGGAPTETILSLARERLDQTTDTNTDLFQMKDVIGRVLSEVQPTALAPTQSFSVAAPSATRPFLLGMAVGVAIGIVVGAGGLMLVRTALSAEAPAPMAQHATN